MSPGPTVRLIFPDKTVDRTMGDLGVISSAEYEFQLRRIVEDPFISAEIDSPGIFITRAHNAIIKEFGMGPENWESIRKGLLRIYASILNLFLIQMGDLKK